MADSEELATAFQDAKRSAIVPTLSPEGFYSQEVVHFIDSVRLRDSLLSLRAFKLHQWTQGEERHIPILFFSLDYEEPVLVDKFYLSKALSDLVVIVQNSRSEERRVGKEC